MGRNPKPTQSLKLSGTFREDRHGRRQEPKHASGLPEMPDGLAGRAAQEWQWLMGVIDQSLVQATDRALLASYCIAVEFLEESYKQIRNDGLLVAGSLDQDRRHPSLMTYKQAVEVVSMVSGRFGFSPVDRTKVGAEIGESKDDLAEFLKLSANRRANNS